MAPTTYGNKRRLTRTHVLGGFAALGVVCILFLELSPAPSTPAGTNTPSSSTSQVQQNNELKIDTIPLCIRSDPQFDGTNSFDCTTPLSTIHYEYLDTPQQRSEFISTYSLTSSDETHYARIGIIEAHSRLLGYDMSTGTVINITSLRSEKELQQWWEDYIGA